MVKMLKRLFLIVLVLCCISMYSTVSLAGKHTHTYYINLLGLDSFSYFNVSNQLNLVGANTVIDPVVRHDRDYKRQLDDLWIIAYGFGGYQYSLSSRIPDILCLVDAACIIDLSNEDEKLIGYKWADEIIDIASKGTTIYIFASTEFDFCPTCTRFTIHTIDDYSNTDTYISQNGSKIYESSDGVYIVTSDDGTSGIIKTWIIDKSSKEVFEDVILKVEKSLKSK